jgi:hypothetical protein
LSGKNRQVMSRVNWQTGRIASLPGSCAILNAMCNTPPK